MLLVCGNLPATLPARLGPPRCHGSRCAAIMRRMRLLVGGLTRPARVLLVARAMCGRLTLTLPGSYTVAGLTPPHRPPHPLVSGHGGCLPAQHRIRFRPDEPVKPPGVDGPDVPLPWPSPVASPSLDENRLSWCLLVCSVPWDDLLATSGGRRGRHDPRVSSLRAAWPGGVCNPPGAVRNALVTRWAAGYGGSHTGHVGGQLG